MVSQSIGPVHALEPPRRRRARGGWHPAALGVAAIALSMVSAVEPARAGEPSTAAAQEPRAAGADETPGDDSKEDARDPLNGRGAPPGASASSVEDTVAASRAPGAPETAEPLPAVLDESETAQKEDQAPAMVWGGSFCIAGAVAAAGVGSGLLLASRGTGDTTAKWTSVGLYIGAGVAFVVGLSLAIVGSGEATDAAEADAPAPTAASVALSPTAGGLLLHGAF